MCNLMLPKGTPPKVIAEAVERHLEAHPGTTHVRVGMTDWPVTEFVSAPKQPSSGGEGK